jgi:hypothetical protein
VGKIYLRENNRRNILIIRILQIIRDKNYKSIKKRGNHPKFIRKGQNINKTTNEKNRKGRQNI